MGNSYRRIGSVAHNLGHSFLSCTNSVDRHGYTLVAPVLFGTASELRVPRVHIDFLRQTIEPPELAVYALRESIRIYARALPRLLDRQGVAPDSVVAASLTLTFDHARTRPGTVDPADTIPEFTCVVEMTDDRGRLHRAVPTVW